MLMNYQAALMKAYYDAGLKALAGAAGYPLAAIQSNSQFSFILEAWGGKDLCTEGEVQLLLYSTRAALPT